MESSILGFRPAAWQRRAINIPPRCYRMLRCWSLVETLLWELWTSLKSSIRVIDRYYRSTGTCARSAIIWEQKAIRDEPQFSAIERRLQFPQ
jgi:hypothetical protein